MPSVLTPDAETTGVAPGKLNSAVELEVGAGFSMLVEELNA